MTKYTKKNRQESSRIRYKFNKNREKVQNCSKTIKKVENYWKLRKILFKWKRTDTNNEKSYRKSLKIVQKCDKNRVKIAKKLLKITERCWKIDPF